MKYILLLVALNQQPNYLGSYDSLDSCKNAIRAIYATRLLGPTLQYSQQQMDYLNSLIDSSLHIQRDYRCVAKKQH